MGESCGVLVACARHGMVAPLGSMTWHLLTQVGCSGLFSTLQGDQDGHF